MAVFTSQLEDEVNRETEAERVPTARVRTDKIANAKTEIDRVAAAKIDADRVSMEQRVRGTISRKVSNVRGCAPINCDCGQYIIVVRTLSLGFRRKQLYCRHLLERGWRR